jgi:hypothetical protein
MQITLSRGVETDKSETAIHFSDDPLGLIFPCRIELSRDIKITFLKFLVLYCSLATDSSEDTK